MGKYIGDKSFYKRILKVMLPIVIQQGITNFVSLLDNIMVGQVGTEQMSGVAITNQLLFVFQLCIFGGLAGAGIFCAQYYGKGDQEKLQSVFRYKVLITIVFSALAMGIFYFFHEPLIRLFLNDTGAGDLEATLQYGKEYLFIMLFEIIPFAVVQLYSSTMRETGETAIPMHAGIIAVLSNMVLNYVLIFGHFGAPAMGVQGAALATTISRFIELSLIVAYAIIRKDKFPYFVGMYRTLKVPKDLAKDITFKGMPLLVNELLWSVGMTFLVQCYSTRGLDAVAAYNISSTVSNTFSIVAFAMGNAISILVGQELGAGEYERAIDTNRKLHTTGIFTCIIAMVLLIIAAPLFPKIYNTSDEIRNLAKLLLYLDAGFMIVRGIASNSYFTLRSGGKTLITFMFDAAFMWMPVMPCAYLLAHYTGISMLGLYFCVQMFEAVKAVIGLILVKRKKWVNNLTV